MIKAQDIGLKQEELNSLLSIFESNSKIESAILFGSRVLGKYKNGSDIDIVIQGNYSHKDWLDLMIEIDELDLPYMFDIIKYDKIDNPNLISHIQRVGKFLHNKKSG